MRAETITVAGTMSQVNAVCDGRGLFLRHGGFERRIEIALAVGPPQPGARHGERGDEAPGEKHTMPGALYLEPSRHCT